jgi:hypothetical protein
MTLPQNRYRFYLRDRNAAGLGASRPGRTWSPFGSPGQTGYQRHCRPLRTAAPLACRAPPKTEILDRGVSPPQPRRERPVATNVAAPDRINRYGLEVLVPKSYSAADTA